MGCCVHKYSEISSEMTPFFIPPSKIDLNVLCRPNTGPPDNVSYTSKSDHCHMTSLSLYAVSKMTTHPPLSADFNVISHLAANDGNAPFSSMVTLLGEDPIVPDYIL